MAWVGVGEFKAAMVRVAADADRAARTLVTRTAALVEKRAKSNFAGAHKRGEPHVGGDKPNVVSGDLRRSITHDPVERLGFTEYGTRVGPATVYARRVELGFPGGDGPGHQATRAFPYFGPAVEESKPKMRSMAEETWDRFLHGGG